MEVRYSISSRVLRYVDLQCMVLVIREDAVCYYYIDMLHSLKYDF